ncbi:MAG: OmpH family outer membrane protein [Longimicrobiales bacterium]|nr:OmpH family outer membrane protein [Longimicrobiales bacterium]
MEIMMVRAAAVLSMTFLLASGAGLAAQESPTGRMSLTAQETPGLKVGFINSDAILRQTPGYQQAVQQFQMELQQMETSLQPRRQELDQMIADYEAQSQALSDTARALREEAILQKQAQVQEEAGQMQEQAQQRQAQLMQPVMDQVSEAIESVRVQGGYALIFDVAAGGLVAADPALDLTDQVVAHLGRATATPGPGGDH